MRRPRLPVGHRRVIVVLAGGCALISLVVRSVVLPDTATTWDTIFWIFEGITLIVMFVFAVALSGAPRRRRDIDLQGVIEADGG
jgi:hypothetical protein